jgi:squalene cyclase
VEYLISSQKTDGTWDETECTGTGFPKVFYLAYTLYRNNFTLMALGTYRSKLQAAKYGHHSEKHSPESGRIPAH